jgi:GINS complex subunit 2
MSSTLAALDNLACYHAAFQADDELIEIIPKFDLDHPLPLLSASPMSVGPFKAGILARVPLWLALFLQHGAFCEVAPPQWLQHLAAVLDYERTHATLFADETKLPRHYYEFGKRLELEKSAEVLLNDVLQVRIDKLRHQFQTVLSDKDRMEESLLLAVDGIGSQELALLRDFVCQALNDQQALNARQQDEEATVQTEEGGEDTKAPPALRSRVAIRRFRS